MKSRTCKELVRPIAACSCVHCGRGCRLLGRRIAFLCQNKHNFDISRDGYINLLVKQVMPMIKIVYIQKAIIQSGFRPDVKGD